MEKVEDSHPTTGSVINVDKENAPDTDHLTDNSSKRKTTSKRKNKRKDNKITPLQTQPVDDVTSKVNKNKQTAAMRKEDQNALVEEAVAYEKLFKDNPQWANLYNYLRKECAVMDKKWSDMDKNDFIKNQIRYKVLTETMEKMKGPASKENIAADTPLLDGMKGFSIKWDDKTSLIVLKLPKTK